MSIVAAILLAALVKSPTPAGAPQVVATSPRNGETIASGRFTLRVHFDRPMADGSWSFVQVSPESFPDCPGQPRQLRDRRSFEWACVAAPGRAYELWFNRPPYSNFKSTAGVPARPQRLRFVTR